MNVKCQGHSFTLAHCHSDSMFSNFFSLETARPIKPRFHIKPQWDGGTKVKSNGSGHITNMAAMHIYGKSLKNIFSGTKRLITLKCSLQHRVLQYYQICLMISGTDKEDIL